MTLREVFQFTGADVEGGILAASPDGKRPASLKGFVAEEAAKELNSVLDLDVFELLAGGLVKLAEVRECADPAKHPPGERIVKSMGETSVVAPVHATLQVRVDGVQVVPELKFTVELEAKFEGMRLVIKGGRVRAVQPGAAWAVVALKLGETTLRKVASEKWEGRGEIALGAEGVAI
jgi:hypothetical protein